MSAIYGCVPINKKCSIDIDQDLKAFDQYTFDRISNKNINSIYFSCFIQEITLESTKEELPFYDKKGNCLITSDAIIDNREEVADLLGIDYFQSLSDSELILKAYYQWDYDFPKYIVGDFAIGIYDFNKDELILVRDHMGNRSLYYALTEESFKFSTLEEPLSTFKKYNADYIRRMISLKFPLNYFNESDTIYKDVYYVKPSEIIIYKSGKISKQLYWKLKRKKRKTSIEEDFAEVKKIFIEAVRCRLRSKDNIGIMLSGGLDSNSIAYIAADILQNQSKYLYSFTSKSDKKYKMNYSKSIMTDESEVIDIIMVHYNNVIATSSSYSNYDSFNIIDKALDIYEEPYKFIENSSWLYNLYKDASEKKCKVLLSGQIGNYTLTYDNIHKHLILLLKELKFKNFFDDLKNYCGYKRYSRKKLLKDLFKLNFFGRKYNSLNHFTSFSKLHKKEINKVKKYDHIIHKSQYQVSKKHSVLKVYTSSTYLNAIGAAETKYGLKNSLISRDPMRDVRLIEKCYNLSPHIFNHEGAERALIKKIMRGIVPDEILDSKKKGLQSGDWLNRLENKWEFIVDSIKADLNYLPDGLIDIEIFENKLNDYKELDLSAQIEISEEINDILFVYITAKFFKNIKKNNKDNK